MYMGPHDYTPDHATARAMADILRGMGFTTPAHKNAFESRLSGFSPELRGKIARLTDLVGPIGAPAVRALVEDLYDEAYSDGLADAE